MTSTAHQHFIDRVEAFLAETGLPMSRLGQLAVNDGSFVADLRLKVREPRLSTIERVDRFMDEYRAEHRAGTTNGDKGSAATRVTRAVG